MQSLQDYASEKSGIPVERAFAVDEPPSLFDLLGYDFFVTLSTRFYRRVYTDSETWFKDIFAPRVEADAVQNQYEFLIGRFGGPKLYWERKGHPALIGRHAPFDVSPAAAERWLMHMGAVLDELEGEGKVDADSKRRILDFLGHTAWFLVGGQEARKAREAAAAKK
ncbi:bacterial-like globin-domain-containing protein [Hyaloraphidium curvatum]|nr:bacterial-like globin-domain-containing protein [Hyaloraphidium curvatum]